MLAGEDRGEEAPEGGGEGLEVLEAKPRHEEFKAGDDEKKWEELIKEEDDVKVRQLTCVEVISSRHSRHVVAAVGKIYARLRYMGLPVLRVHSDRARELTSADMFKWARDRNILRTYTDGDSWKMNGRAEAEIGMISRSAKTLLADAGLDTKFWPLAARHAAERRLRGQLLALQLPVKSLLPVRELRLRQDEGVDRPGELEEGESESPDHGAGCDHQLGGLLREGRGREVLPHDRRSNS